MPTELYKPTISVEVCNRKFILHRAASLEDLWDNMTKQAHVHGQEYLDFDDERLPYWTELWPSSIALSEWLNIHQDSIKDNICLDVGCGLGLTALVGHTLGAKVLAFDYEIEALSYAKKNTFSNAAHYTVNHGQVIMGPLWLGMDWRRPAIKKHSIEFLWGADIMYERKFAYSLMEFLDFALTKHGRAWIAEPCRSVYEHFSAELVRRKWQAKKVHTAQIEPIYAQPVPVNVQVWEICR